jgi:hypothetical protein
VVASSRYYSVFCIEGLKKTIDVAAEIATGYNPNMNSKSYRYANLVDVVM